MKKIEALGEYTYTHTQGDIDNKKYKNERADAIEKIAVSFLCSDGITLVALIITIIVLLILAGVAISITLNSGIFSKSEEALNAYEQSSKEEDTKLKIVENRIDDILNREPIVITDYKISNVTGSSLKVSIKAKEPKGDAITYEIYVNGEKKSTKTGSSQVAENYEITGLTGTEFRVRVKAMSEKGEQTQTKEIKITGLYLSGNENIGLTGGWQLAGYDSGSITKNGDNMVLTGNSVDSAKHYTAINTANSINITDYNELVWEMSLDNETIISEKYTTWMEYTFNEVRYQSYDQKNIKHHPISLNSMTNSMKDQRTYISRDISSLTGNCYPTIVFSRWYTNPFVINCTTYNMWLVTYE